MWLLDVNLPNGLAQEIASSEHLRVARWLRYRILPS
jgi:hypothetical protein